MRTDRIVDLISKNGHVSRYHTERLIGSETIAEHSWGVAMLCVALSGGLPSAELLKCALYHDLAEHVTGDSPAPAKWSSAELRNALRVMEEDFDHEYFTFVDLTEGEMLIFKMADMLQLMIFVQGQWKMGNRTLDPIFERGFRYLEEEFVLPDLALDILIVMRRERNTK